VLDKDVLDEPPSRCDRDPIGMNQGRAPGARPADDRSHAKLSGAFTRPPNCLATARRLLHRTMCRSRSIRRETVILVKLPAYGRVPRTTVVRRPAHVPAKAPGLIGAGRRFAGKKPRKNLRPFPREVSHGRDST